MVVENSKGSAETRQSFVETTVRDLRERLFDLSTFDRDAEVHSLCDDLQSQVMLAVESAMKHLTEIQTELLDEIDAYRSRLLEKRRPPVDVGAELAALKREVDEFEQRCIDGIETESSNAKNKAESFRERTRALKRQLRKSAFCGEFMSFCSNRLFSLQGDYIGKLEIANHDYYSDEQLNCFPLEPYSSISTSALFKTLWLANGTKLLIFRTNHTLLLRDLATGKEASLASSDSTRNDYVDALELPSGHLLTCRMNGRIDMWNLAFEQLRSFSGLGPATVSLKLLPNGNFASLCFDDRFKIWNPRLGDDKCLQLTMSGHGCRESFMRGLGLLSNGFLVTCSDDKDNSIVRVWDPVRGRLVKQIPTGIEWIFNFVVLSSDDLVVMPVDGSIRIINLADESLSKTLSEAKSEWHAWVQELPNGCILGAAPRRDPLFKIWEPRSGRVVQSIVSKHRELFISSSISPDRSSLMTSALDGSVLFWPFVGPFFSSVEPIKQDS